MTIPSENNTNIHIKDGSTTFHHPYKPYDIQLDFMQALYETLEHKKVGIFESPTGKKIKTF